MTTNAKGHPHTMRDAAHAPTPRAPRARRHSQLQRELLPRRAQNALLALLAAVWFAAAAAAAAELRRSTLTLSLQRLPTEQPSAGARAAHATAARDGLRRALRQAADTSGGGGGTGGGAASAITAAAAAPGATATAPAPAPAFARRAGLRAGNGTQRAGNSSSSSSSSDEGDPSSATVPAPLWDKLHAALLVGLVLGLSACLCAALTPTYFFPFPFL
jgi:hypothetical protein